MKLENTWSYQLKGVNDLAEKFIWRDKKLKLIVNAESKKVLKDACILVEKTAKDSIGRVPPPAPPEHPPAAPTGTLKGRITHELDPTKLEGRVGTNLEYARRVELGFVGTDKLGRIYNQAPRPYLRPALHKCEKTIKASV
ncbi:hypothetical protein ES703_113881 [subsurface metagenome]